MRKENLIIYTHRKARKQTEGRTMKTYSINEFHNGVYREGVAVWDDNCHPYISSAEWHELVETGEVSVWGKDGNTIYYID